MLWSINYLSIRLFNNNNSVFCLHAKFFAPYLYLLNKLINNPRQTNHSNIENVIKIVDQDCAKIVDQDLTILLDLDEKLNQNRLT